MVLLVMKKRKRIILQAVNNVLKCYRMLNFLSFQFNERKEQ